MVHDHDGTIGARQRLCKKNLRKSFDVSRRLRLRLVPMTKKMISNVMSELGRRGRGAAKRRGDSAYYSRLRKGQKKVVKKS